MTSPQECQVLDPPPPMSLLVPYFNIPRVTFDHRP